MRLLIILSVNFSFVQYAFGQISFTFAFWHDALQSWKNSELKIFLNILVFIFKSNFRHIKVALRLRFSFFFFIFNLLFYYLDLFHQRVQIPSFFLHPFQPSFLCLLVERVFNIFKFEQLRKIINIINPIDLKGSSFNGRLMG